MAVKQMMMDPEMRQIFRELNKLAIQQMDEKYGKITNFIIRK